MSRGRDLLAHVKELIEDDLRFLTREQRAQTTDATKSREQFVAHLASIISQPIGLRASVAPFNESSESMFAYLMEMFCLSQDQLERLLAISGEQPSPTGRNCKIRQWQPELKLKINPPIFDGTNTDNITVKLMVEEYQQANVEAGSRNIFDVIRMRGGDRLKTVASQDRVLVEIGYIKRGNTYLAELITGLSDIVVVDDRGDGEVRLRLRGHKISNQKIRIEFWIQCLKRFNLKRFVACSCCGSDGDREATSKDQILLGTTSIKLSQIPAYATRNSYPILSSHHKLVNNCDILTQIRNGNLVVKDETIVDNHVRLYAICIAYQLNLLTNDGITSRLSKLPRFEAARSANLNLDSLLYLPAFSLINQHRLRYNISHQEDQSICRSAILLLLTRMESLNVNRIYSDSHRLLLASIAEHEYLNAHRHFNNTTRQEVDPFQPGLSHDGSREQVQLLEYHSIDDCAKELVSGDRIRTWLSRVNTMGFDSKKADVLVGLRLVKTIILHNMNNSMVHPRFSGQSAALKNYVEKLLTDTVSDELKLRLRSILINMQPLSPVKQNKRSDLRCQPDNPWCKLFCDIHSIENDLVLHWSDLGLDSLKLNKTGSALIDDESMSKLQAIIESKIRNYLAS